MPKRNAVSHKELDGANNAKKLRTECTGAADTHPADSDPNASGSPKSILARADLAQRIATQTLRLADVIGKTGSSCVQRMQAIVDLLEADADRSESLLDLSLVPEGDVTCVMFQLLHFFYDCVSDGDDAEDVKADKNAAQELIFKVLSLKEKLLRSFDPDTVDAATGNNALHEMCSLFSLHDVDDWPYKLTEQFIAHGVSVHARNKEGRTPLLEWAALAGKSDSSVAGLQLLLQCGADLDVQDNNGNGVLHLLVQRKAALLLDDLFDGDGAGPLDFTLRNSAGQTAADLAAIQLEEQADGSADSPERRIHRLMATHTAMWTEHRQPALLKCGPQQAAAAAANGSDSLQTALARAKLAPRIAMQTLKLADTIKKKGSSFTQRMQSVINLLKADAARPESLLDLSLVSEGDELLVFFFDCVWGSNDAEDVKADKIAAAGLISKALHLQQKLLRSFDPVTADPATGDNALHAMCRYFSLFSVHHWSYKLTEHFIAHGVSVHARNKKGRTPLLQRAASLGKSATSAICMRLLLQHGADPNVQDNSGNGLLHLLIQNQASAPLEDLFGSDVSGGLDHALRNAKSQTAADLAAIQLAELQDESEEEQEEEEEDEEEAQRREKKQRARRIYRLMAAQAAMWAKHVRPALLRCLETVLLVSDLAKLTLGYIDGSGLPFATAEADEATEPAAAAAAQF